MASNKSATPASERRLTANRANAQKSTGPISAEGKAKSSLNAVKTGLCGRTLLFADEEEAAAYRAHVARLIEYWEPADVREHTLVQSLADTQWRLDSIPGLESGLYALGRRRYAELFADVEDPAIRRVLLDAHIEEVDAPAFRNLRLHERRLERRYLADETDLDKQRDLRLAEEERKAKEEKEKEAEAQRRRQQAERKKTRKGAEDAPIQPEKCPSESRSTHHGFEFSNPINVGEIPPSQCPAKNADRHES